MDTGYIFILILLVAGVAFGLAGKKPAEEKKSKSGWVALIVLLFLVGGLVAADMMGNETLTWMFGLSLMIVLPIMMFFAIGAALGSVFRKGDGGKK